MSTDADHWKEKYLDSIQHQDDREAEWQTRFELLRRSLTRTSMAAEGQDQRLDTCLHELRTLLRQDNCDQALNELTPRLEKAMLDNEQRRHERIAQIALSLRHMAEQLRELPNAHSLRRNLKRFCKQLDDRLGRWAELQRIVHELESLQQQILQTPDTPPPRTLLQRLLGLHPVPTTASGFSASAPDSPALNRSPAAPVGAATEVDDEDEDELPTATTTPTPPEDKPAVTEPEPTNAPSTPLIPTAPLALAVTPEPSSTDFIGPLPAATVPILAELNWESDTEPSNEPPPYSSVAVHIEGILLSLLEDLHLPEQWQPQAESLQRRITRGLNWYELVPVLEDLATLLRGLPLFDHQFEDYLKQLNQRLSLMQETVLRVQNGRTQQNQTTEAFEVSLRQQVRSLQTSVDQATDLSSLKQVVEERLDHLLSAIDDYQRQSQANEQRLTESLNQLGDRLTGMESVAVELRGHLEEQQRKAQFDPLTGLPNRTALSERLKREIERWQQRGDSLLLAILDVDHFKRINDTYGHLAGDRVLKILAHRWQEQLRASDFLARYGGEEFILLMPSTPLATGLQVLEQLRTTIEACPFHFKGERLQITVSAGLTAFAKDCSEEQVFEAADQALYQAKHAGRNRVEQREIADLANTPPSSDRWAGFYDEN